MTGEGENFLARWSRRKGQAKVAATPAARPGPLPGGEGQGAGEGVEEPADRSTLAPVSSAQAVAPPAAGGPGEAPPPGGLAPHGEPAAAPLPTLADVAALTRDSDYSRFVAGGVDEGVKRAALKKLFSDPHFNIMDGLDTYIGDYNTPDPIPPSMLRKMWQSKALGLFDDEEEGKAQASPDGAPLAPVSQSAIAAAASPAPAVPPDEDTDLRLQPDDESGRAGAGEGARPGEG